MAHSGGVLEVLITDDSQIILNLNAVIFEKCEISQVYHLRENKYAALPRLKKVVIILSLDTSKQYGTKYETFYDVETPQDFNFLGPLNSKEKSLQNDWVIGQTSSRLVLCGLNPQLSYILRDKVSFNYWHTPQVVRT